MDADDAAADGRTNPNASPELIKARPKDTKKGGVGKGGAEDDEMSKMRGALGARPRVSSRHVSLPRPRAVPRHRIYSNRNHHSLTTLWPPRVAAHPTIRPPARRRSHRHGKAGRQVGRRRGPDLGEGSAERGGHPPGQVPAVFHRETQSVERFPSVRSPRHREVFPRESGGHGGGLDVFQVRSVHYKHFFTHRSVSIFDRGPFQLTGELTIFVWNDPHPSASPPPTSSRSGWASPRSS